MSNENSDKQIYCELATAIVKRQAEIIGLDMAVKKAKDLPEFILDDEGNVMAVYGKPINSLELLVSQYSKMSGNTAVNFCKDAIISIVTKYPDIKLPNILQIQKATVPTMEQFLESF
ncbi:hypothetical protein A2X44_02550 [candidate division CPR3 bacterium GWF2_35_18]|uniref:Uncharacterized protein n=1 Tax=candidate division CPR3 bacterium GW2011_GWF2_35_18 TaxID=1618350 RepID=A0A0G0C1U3_UNCC3|nr:MAG: hypothetical protein UR67_C0002G0191 [candidate division CPR3 bacterium GW2011_GWF2_35_18]OGB62874.1 MAG: hypothetical protein A2X44_02550 [candidate division CPR3 bacterium GWF2_35_18]OGB65455.1 MAG: hypothetical protein A2250_00765 [candidate division CPR3 bacterium RIFOXYA2_FULL_35_13]OGB75873.1 MAG: hypothetical protein A2476_03190 [candidate division CPR3 bacterium RIFOXYC2_FULL_35_7]OGB78913.1 MAG: hypothetical protein A2296_04285 [candidate division CPR3 bacterium RIFOXYB2_FULL_3